MAPKWLLPRPPQLYGKVREVGRAAYVPSLGPSLATPGPAPRRCSSEGRACSPHLTHPVKRTREGGGPTRGHHGGRSQPPEQAAKLHVRLRPGTQDIAAAPALCVGPWQVGPCSGTEGRPDRTWRPAAKSTESAAGRGRASLPGDQSPSPLMGFKLFP